jgi:hypothetical protein
MSYRGLSSWLRCRRVGDEVDCRLPLPLMVVARWLGAIRPDG